MRLRHSLTALLAGCLLLASAGCQTPSGVQSASASAVLIAPAGAAVIAPAAVPRVAPAGAASPDYDGDGKADIAVTLIDDSDVSSIRVWLGSGVTVDLPAAELTPDAGVLDPDAGIRDPLLSSDLNGDGFSDLVFVTRGSQLNVVPGSPSGPQLAARHTFELPNSENAYAVSLALIESPTPRLAVGMLTDANVGQVILVHVNAAGAPSGPATILRLGKTKLPKLTDSGSFGSAMASVGSQLFVGVPSASLVGARYAGAVVAITLGATGVTKATTITQSTKGVIGVPGKYDYFGSSLAARDGYLVVGTIGDAVGSIKNTGSVQVFTLSKGKVTPKARLSQASPGVPGKAEWYDHFGWTVAMTTSCAGVPAVLVGGPSEVITKEHQGDGSAWLIPLKPVKGCPARQLYEGHGLSGTPHFRLVGYLLAAIRDRGAVDDDLVIIGPGSYSQGPEGRLYRWSAASLGSVFSADGLYGGVAGR